MEKTIIEDFHEKSDSFGDELYKIVIERTKDWPCKLRYSVIAQVSTNILITTIANIHEMDNEVGESMLNEIIEHFKGILTDYKDEKKLN